ncbi:MAG: hypothetical protein ACAI43_06980 [Phycisphaerae bacterium]|nr:hypothetical protein [Tepidisphaeraceae bacterium]
MIVYVGKTFSSAVTGGQLQRVDCEKCATEYYYELVRVGTGAASAPYLIGQNSAANRASRAAEKALAKRLAREAEMVPCPQCNWVHSSLIDRYRRRQYSGFVKLVVLVSVLGLLAVPFIRLALADDRGRNRDGSGAGMMPWVIAAPFILSAAWLLPIRAALRRRINPNRTFPNAPALPPGTPPAMVRRPDPRTGEDRLEAVPRPAVGEDESVRPGQVGREWVTYRAGQVTFPSACCVCMAPATTQYSAPFKVREGDELDVPLCVGCARGLKAKWWLTALATALLLAGVLALVAWGGVLKVDATGRTILFTAGCIIGIPLFVAVIPTLVTKPYKLKVVDKDRAIFRLTTTSPEFVRALREQVRESEGR